jgi:hypothetical protein
MERGVIGRKLGWSGLMFGITTVNLKLLGAAMAGFGSVILAITYCYLLWRHKTNLRLRLIFLLGLFASVLWMLGFGFAAMLEFYGRKGLMADMVYLPLLAGSLILILTGILGWVHRAGGL